LEIESLKNLSGKRVLEKRIHESRFTEFQPDGPDQRTAAHGRAGARVSHGLAAAGGLRPLHGTTRVWARPAPAFRALFRTGVQLVQVPAKHASGRSGRTAAVGTRVIQ
jgi:hypothetical protein